MITLKSGKELQETKVCNQTSKEGTEKEVTRPNSFDEMPKTLMTPPYFPQRSAKTKKDTQEEEIFETFCKVEVNIPLLDAIKQVPHYAKLFKELCTSKKKLNGNENVRMRENVFVVIQKKLLKKCKDPGASINVMPYSIYSANRMGPLKETGVIIQLADRTNVYPTSVLEDVWVQVNGLVFPVDFYVIEMEEENSSDPNLILLGRPFLKTSKIIINVYEGTLTMEFDGEVIKFNIHDAMKYPNIACSLFALDVIDPLVQEGDSL
ncbi:uncharacterized protein LOC105771823 [Gossypium raimondii]|uniref:uncharacterized protein LOC105771823 n=1 Tax=Gossypium raimondii TaxID=29730 RepID=UPI00063AB3A3|nr:uncharacterized protein LOC105771823 [Gossypium raimondii]